MTEPIHRSAIIPYPADISEFEIHATLYRAFRSSGIDARGEVRTYSPDTRARGARLDLVIFAQQRQTIQGISCPVNAPIAIIEVKRARRHTNGPIAQKIAERASQQYQRYARLGVPVIVCQGMSQIHPTLSRVQEIISESESQNGR